MPHDDQSGRYGAQSSGWRGQSVDSALSAIEVQLKNQGDVIKKISEKMDSVGLSVAAINTQMRHLVTKAECSEGRRELSEDLKARMDGDREITGVGITVPKMLQQYAEAANAQRTVASSPPSPDNSQSISPVVTIREHKTTAWYIRMISAIVSLTFAIITITFFAYRIVERMDRQQTVMQDIQRNLRALEKNSDR